MKGFGKDGQKWTPELQEAFCEAFKKGLPITFACGKVGITTTTFYRWLQWAEERKEPYLSFFMAIMKAKASRVERGLDAIAKAGDSGPQHWTAWAWELERSHPNEFGRRSGITVDQRGIKGARLIQRIIDGECEEITDGENVPLGEIKMLQACPKPVEEETLCEDIS